MITHYRKIAQLINSSDVGPFMEYRVIVRSNDLGLNNYREIPVDQYDPEMDPPILAMRGFSADGGPSFWELWHVFADGQVLYLPETEIMDTVGELFSSFGSFPLQISTSVDVAVRKATTGE